MAHRNAICPSKWLPTADWSIPIRKVPAKGQLSREQWNVLETALSRLSDAHREAVLLRHRENLSFAEIGSRMQKSEDAARKIWTRAIEQLKKGVAAA